MSVAPLNLSWATQTHVRGTSSALGEPDWLTADRLAALERVAELPAEPNQLFTPYLDLRAVDFAAVEPYPPTPAAECLTDAELPEGAAALVHVDERAVVGCALSDEAREAGVIIASLADVARDRPELVREFIEGGGSLPHDDAFGQVARAFTRWASSSTCPPASTWRLPSCCAGAPARPGFGLISRTIISLGRNAHASIFEEQVASAAASLGGRRARRLHLVGQHRDRPRATAPRSTSPVSRTSVRARRPSSRARRAWAGTRPSTGRWPASAAGCIAAASRTCSRVAGASVNQVEIGFGDGKQLFDLTSYTRHRGEDTTSDLLSKGVFTGTSRGYIKGLIDIPHSGRGTDSFLGRVQHAAAAIGTLGDHPQPGDRPARLRRAMHSSSVGPIDENQVFYLMSRGLSRDAARKAIVLGFLEPVVARIPLPAAQDRLRELLERKWPEGATRDVAA